MMQRDELITLELEARRQATALADGMDNSAVDRGELLGICMAVEQLVRERVPMEADRFGALLLLAHEQAERLAGGEAEVSIPREELGSLAAGVVGLATQLGRRLHLLRRAWKLLTAHHKVGRPMFQALQEEDPEQLRRIAREWGERCPHCGDDLEVVRALMAEVFPEPDDGAPELELPMKRPTVGRIVHVSWNRPSDGNGDAVAAIVAHVHPSNVELRAELVAFIPSASESSRVTQLGSPLGCPGVVFLESVPHRDLVELPDHPGPFWSWPPRS